MKPGRATKTEELARCAAECDEPRAFGATGLPPAYELVNRQSDVLCDLSQQDRRKIPAPMIRDSRAPAVRMPKLLMRAALAGLGKTQAFQNGNGLSRFENRDFAHVQLTVTV